MTSNNVQVDISIGDDSGPRAARYLGQQARSFPPMRALVLVLKAYLRNQGLNEVSSGGLSSYSLCNMVIVHLQEELKVRARLLHVMGGCLPAWLPAIQAVARPAPPCATHDSCGHVTAMTHVVM